MIQKLNLIRTSTLVLLLGAALSACNRAPDVAQERANLKATQEKVTKDVQDAQTKAIKDVNDTKEDAARKIQNAQKSLQDAQDQANGLLTEPSQEKSTQSGSTTAAGEDAVTPAECAKYTLEKTIKPELKSRYEACSKLNRK